MPMPSMMSERTHRETERERDERVHKQKLAEPTNGDRVCCGDGGGVGSSTGKYRSAQAVSNSSPGIFEIPRLRALDAKL